MTPRLVVRIGRGATAVRISRSTWGFPDWQWQHDDGTFGCRARISEGCAGSTGQLHGRFARVTATASIGVLR